MIAGQVAATECPPEVTVNKWQAFRTVCEAKNAIGVTDRSLVVLNALLSFHPESDLSAGDDLIVFPSNEQLALRAHGMASATLRRHLAVLVECGLLFRRDSPNGKRYARKTQSGSIEQAFGFDLTPLVVRSAELSRLAEQVRAERRSLQLLRERITLCRRDIAKMIALGLEEHISADWARFQTEYQTLVTHIPRSAKQSEMALCETQLQTLASELRKILETHVKSQNMSTKESHFERHIHESKPNPIEIEIRQLQPSNANRQKTPDTGAAMPPRYSLDMVLRACPDIADYAKNGISSWINLIDTANLVRSALGITGHAWQEACETMGAVDTAIITAAILQRSEKITSPGGYLRSLTGKAKSGHFSVEPALTALLRKQSTVIGRYAA